MNKPSLSRLFRRLLAVEDVPIYSNSNFCFMKHEQTYFTTYSGAVQLARESAENKGYEIDEQDWFNRVNVGEGRPNEGKTSRSIVGLLKNGKQQKKALTIVVYNMGYKYQRCYELTFYIS